MPKTIRISDHLASRLEPLAEAEQRSLSNLVSLLLERALAASSGNAGTGGASMTVTVPPADPDLVSWSWLGKEGDDDSHFKPDPK